MNFETLSIVKFGDVDSLGEFLFENGTQHKLFQQTLQRQGINVPIFPITDANTDNLDDWLLGSPSRASSRLLRYAKLRQSF
jgi:hypothetical protein